MLSKLLLSKLITFHEVDEAVLRKTVPASSKNAVLEVMRGAAALMVFVGHLYTKINGMPQIGFAKYLLYWGTEAVIIFFILSGFVIRLSQERRQRSFSQFFIDRLIRLYPLYVLVVLFSSFVVVFQGVNFSTLDLLGNLVFLQSRLAYIVQVVPANEALWSLSYEVAFYLMFALSLLHKRWFLAWGFLCSFSIVLYSFELPIHWLEHFKIIFAFSAIWLLGYITALYRNQFRFESSFAIAMLPLALIVDRTNFITVAPPRYDFYSLAGFALFCLPLFNVVTSRAAIEVKVNRFLTWSVYISVLFLYWLLSDYPTSLKILLSVLSIGGLLFSGQIAMLKLHSENLSNLMLYLGSISYALYIIHMPILYLLNHLVQKQPWLILMLTVASTWLMAHGFDLILQPKIARFLKKHCFPAVYSN